MRIVLVCGVALAVLAVFGDGEVRADTVLYDYGVISEGTVAYPIWGDPLPPSVDVSGFDDSTGLGRIEVDLSTAGSHHVAAFFDIEIDETWNTFFNEFGGVFGGGAEPVGFRWEIDEPGYVFGDIYDNFEGGTLDNTNALPVTDPDDASFAMSWDFTLFAGDTAAIVFDVTDIVPVLPFYLSQTDDVTLETIYLSSSIDIERYDPGSGTPPSGGVVPLPSAAWMGMALLAGLGGFRRWRRRQNA